MRRATIWRSVAGGLMVLGLLGSMAVATGPAAAYSPNPTVVTATRNTSNCPCSIEDTADSTYFKHDAGGVGVKITLFKNGDMVAKVEFHPYGEYLWIYDTKADGDAIYVTLTANYDVEPTRFPSSGAYKSPTVSGRYSYVRKNLSIVEGVSVTLRVYDNSGPGDLIAFKGGRA